MRPRTFPIWPLLLVVAVLIAIVALSSCDTSGDLSHGNGSGRGCPDTEACQPADGDNGVENGYE